MIIDTVPEKLDREQKKKIKQLFFSVINKSSVQLLRTCNAEQKQLLDLFLQNAEWGAWRVRLVDESTNSLFKIMGCEPVKAKKGKKKKG